ncbi:MAG: cation:proton antiporter [Fimbriimonadales bacterium]|nr:cation:proton antiporter [Fimbriimonadales bacterium]
MIGLPISSAAWPSEVELAIQFFLQLAVILVACRVVGKIAQKFGQAQVVGEMIAGVLLGPSLLGIVWPAAEQYLFPKTLTISNHGLETTVPHPSMSVLYVASQLGLVLYMFIVGLEFNVGMLKERAKSATLVAFTGIAAPFLLGGAAALLLMDRAPLFNPELSQWAAAFFMGSAMCITAFPMLARILYEHRIAATSMGTLALSAGAINDAFAWFLLALVLAASKGDPTIAWIAIGGGTLYTIGMFTVGRYLLAFLGIRADRKGEAGHNLLAASFIVLLMSAWLTDSIGIYAVFGAFITGAAMPRGVLADTIKRYCENVTTVLLVPLFFTYSGLNTSVGLLSSPLLWGITLVLVVVAILGKGLGCMLAARIAGESWRDSATIGALMNARGLIELILLNIGLSAGIITGELFTMLVIMAIVTTLMASPAFSKLNKGRVQAIT